MKQRRLTVGSLIGESTAESSGHGGLDRSSGISRPSGIPVRPASSAPVTRIPASLIIRQNGREMKVTPLPGQTVLSAALAQQLPVAYKCGKGSCGRCAVRVLAETGLSPLNQKEQKTLKEAGSGCRLACQARFQS